MYGKEMEMEALREKIAIVSKKRDELLHNNIELIKEKGELLRKNAEAHMDNLELTRSNAKLRWEKNFWFYIAVAMMAVTVFQIVMRIGGGA